MANNTQKCIIEEKKLIRQQLESVLHSLNVPYEVVGDCDLAFYHTLNGKKRVFKLSGSFCNCNTKTKGVRDAEDVMCDLLDEYEDKQFSRKLDD